MWAARGRPSWIFGYQIGDVSSTLETSFTSRNLLISSFILQFFIPVVAAGSEFFLDDSTIDKSVCFCLLKFSGVLLKYLDL